MSLNSAGYQIKQGFRNIARNKMFSIASIATMTACIFIFGVFASIIMNLNAVRRDLEERVGITVFFTEGTTEEQILEVQKEIGRLDHVTSTRYTSSEEAWENFQKEYFGDDPSLADGFRNDNPLEDSASITVETDRIENQEAVAGAIRSMDRVREVNQSSGAITTLTHFNRFFTYVSAAVIAVLLIVSVILIANTINVGIAVRRDEISIMKLIGATDAFVREPFLVEGFMLGVIGSAIPLVVLYVSYRALLEQLASHVEFLSVMRDSLLGTGAVFRYLVPVALVLGIGIGLLGAGVAVRKHIRV